MVRLVLHLLYMVDRAKKYRPQVNATTQIINTFAGTGEPGFSGEGTAAHRARLHYPTGLAVADGRLFIADRTNQV